jgi:Na+/proline symporter
MTFAAGVFGSFVVYVVIGYIVGRRVRTEEDYYVAGRGAPVYLITGSLIASYLSTVGFMGELGFAYSGYALVLMTLAAVNVSGYVLGVLFFGRYLRRSESITVPEFFGKRFNSRGLQALAGLTILFGLGAYLTAVTQGVSLLLEDLLGIQFWIVLLVVWVAYTSFTLFAGSPGVLWTDTLMFLVFGTAAILGMTYLVIDAGGPSAVLSALSNVEGKQDIVFWQGVTGPNAEYATPAAAIFWGVLFGVVWAVVVATSPWQTSRYLMARTEHTAIRSGFLAMIGVLVMYIFISLGGATINVYNPNIEPTELAFVWAAQNALPTVLGVLAVTGIAAAGLSSASTFLSLCGFSSAHDIAPLFRWGRRQESTSALRFSRVIMLLVGLVVLGVTLVAPPAVFEIGYFAATLFVASWGPLAFICIFSKRITTAGAITGMTAGFVTTLVAEVLRTFGGLELPVYLDPVILGAGAALAGIIVPSMLGRPDERGLEFRESLFGVSPEQSKPEEVKRTLRYAYVAVGASAVVIVLLFLVYFLPFSRTIAAGG